MPLSFDNTKKKGVLGTLFGVIADTIQPTRNDRRYPAELWEKVFKDEFVKEQIANGGIFGELGHPTDRSETDMEKIAIVMPELPKKNKDGKLEARFDILDTPNGRIAKTLVDYGYKLGISSRGNGDIVEDYETGGEMVDADTYDFQAFDLVIIPACKDARLSLVEGVENTRKVKKALQEQIESATEKDKKIMTETLSSLGISCQSSKEADIDVVQSSTEVVGNKSAVMKELREALKKNSELEKQIIELQEKLSVGYTKEVKAREMTAKYNSMKAKLSESAEERKTLEKRVKVLENKLHSSDNRASLVESRCRKADNENTEMQNLLQDKESEIRKLTENLQRMSSKVKSTKTQYENKRNLIESKNRELEQNIVELEEKLTESKKLFESKARKTNRIIENLKNVATEGMNRYITSMSMRIGVTPEEIKNRLGESYTFEDVEMTCKRLQEYKINTAKLPIALSESGRKTNARITKSEERNILSESVRNDADEIDDLLLSVIND